MKNALSYEIFRIKRHVERKPTQKETWNELLAHKSEIKENVPT